MTDTYSNDALKRATAAGKVVIDAGIDESNRRTHTKQFDVWFGDATEADGQRVEARGAATAAVEFVKAKYKPQLDDPGVEVRVREQGGKVQHFVVEVEWALAFFYYELASGCVCDFNPSTTDGPSQDCPVHGEAACRRAAERRRR